MVNLHREESHIILIYLVSAFQVASSENPDSKVLSKSLSESLKFPSYLHFHSFP